jgi:hypothetical protein
MQANIPFEVHLTVAPLAAWQEWDFLQTCEALEAKPIFIELARGQNWQQPMATKSLQAKDTAEAVMKCLPLAMRLNAKGYKVVRTKLETPVQYAGMVFPGEGFEAYFEWHGRVKMNGLGELLDICERHGAHLSRNALKHEPDRRFVTLRTYLHKLDFEERLKSLKQDLATAGISLLKERAEYCVHDTKAQLDEGWLRNGEDANEP